MKKLFLFAAVMFSSISFSSCSEDGNKESQTSQKLLKVGSINSIFYFLHKAAEPFNCLEQDNLTQS